MIDEKRGRGGKRNGAGRKKMTLEQKQVRLQQFRMALIDELIFPAVCLAFNSDPGQWNDRILTIELSATQIRDAYGHEGLREWRSYFASLRKGGRDRFGNPYMTLWRFNNAKYGFIVRLVKAMGYELKSLPVASFPPKALIDRLESFQAKQKARLERRRLEIIECV